MGEFISGDSPRLPSFGEKSEELKEVEHKEAVEEEKLAAIGRSDAWEFLDKKLAADIDRLERNADIDFKQLNDLELGQAVRVDHMLAQKLQSYRDEINDAKQNAENTEEDEEGDDE